MLLHPGRRRPVHSLCCLYTWITHLAKWCIHLSKAHGITHQETIQQAILHHADSPESLVETQGILHSPAMH